MGKQKKSFVQKFIRFYFRALAILAIDLVVSTINNQVVLLTEYVSRPLVTVIGMGIILLMFWFLLTYIDKLTVNILKVTVEFGQNVKFRKTAMIFIMSLLLLIFYILYYFTWFRQWPAWSERWF